MEQFGGSPLGIALFFVLMAVAGVFALAFYMLPTIIGFMKNLPMKWLWFWLNLLLGWTFVMWGLLMLFSIFVPSEASSRVPKVRKVKSSRVAGEVLPVSTPSESMASGVETSTSGSGVNPDHRLPDSSRDVES